MTAETDAQVNPEHLEEKRVSEGIQKFADPQKALLALLAKQRA